MTDLWIALSLVAVIEGLVLFAFPDLWRRVALQMLAIPPGRLRWLGGIVMSVGLATLYWARRR